jgi:septum formation protein
MARRVVLCSGSPRRKALLEAACFEVEVVVSGVDESWPGGTPQEGAMALAERKLSAVPPRREPMIAADTLVILGDQRLEKPRDAADAVRMLSTLAGRRHQVVTGYCIQRGNLRRTGAVTTDVTFRRLSREEIERYVASGEPFDKAGAYAIQGEGGAFVDRVDGSYTNIVGLPLPEVISALELLA